MKPIAICAVFKNEAPFLLEWIAYHRVIGFAHFVLYDNDSTDGGTDLIRSSWAAELSTVLHWPRRPAQLAAYRHFIYNLSACFEWVAFIDLDEFVLPLQQPNVVDLVRSYSAFSAVLVHWHSFGPAGWMQPPEGLVIENYDLRSIDETPVNRHVKSIVKCSDLLDVSGNPHEFQVKGPVCDTLGRVAPNVAIQPVACHEKLVINHYVTRSRQDWMAKIRRGSAVREYDEPKYQEDLFDHFAEICHVEDATIKRFAPAVRALLASAGTPRAIRRDHDPISPAEPVTFGASSVLAHVQNVGDVDGRIGDWIGMRGGGRWIEGFSIMPEPSISLADIEYQVFMSGDAALPWLAGGTFCGSRGLGLPLRGFSLRLAGPAAVQYECCYTATFTDGSVTGLTRSAQPCIAASLAPLEAFRVILRQRSSPLCMFE